MTKKARKVWLWTDFKYFRSVLRELARLANQAAKYRMKVNFKNSEGWKEKAPQPIHLAAPPDLKPIPGKKTAISKNKFIKIKIGDIFFKEFRRILKAKNPRIIPGSKPNNNWWFKK
jgi:hypothetical protein